VAYTVLLEGVNITNKVLSISIDRELNSGVVGFSLETKNIGSVQIFNEIEVKKDGTTLVKGIIVDQTDKGGDTNQLIFSSLDCQDFGYLLNKRIISESYKDETISNVMKDVLTKKAPELTTTAIQENTSKITVRYVYQTLKEVLDSLFDMDARWNYYIDGQNGVHFFKDYEALGTTITAQKIQPSSLSINYDGIEHFNRVWIVGRKQPSASTTEIPFTLNGTQTDFGPLPYEPFNLRFYFTPSGLPEYELNMVEEGQDTSSADGTYNAGKRTFKITPAKTGTLRVTFRPMRQVVEYFENSANITANGVMEKAVTNVDVIDRLEARRYGQAEVNTSSRITKTISFTSTHADLLNAELGQLVTLNIVSGAWNLNGSYLITKINKSITPDIEQVEVEAIEWQV
jgi:hypothetical protein